MLCSSVPFTSGDDPLDDDRAAVKPAADRSAAQGQDLFRGPFRAELHASFDTAEAAWRHAETAGFATSFQTFHWLLALAETVARARKTDIFAVHVFDATGRPVLLLPLVRQKRRSRTIVSVPDFEVCDYLAPILFPGPELSSRCMAEIFNAIRPLLAPADQLEIAKMPAFIAGRENPMLRLAGVRKATLKRSGLPIAQPAGDVVVRVMKPSTYRDFAKFRRRLHKAGEARFVLASTVAQTEEILNAMISQRRTRFLQMGRENLMDLPEIERFYRSAASDGLKGGPVRLFGFSVDGEWVATSYGLVHGASFALVAQTMAGGEWRKLSPGLIVTAETMEWAAAQGLRFFDFTVGPHAYKKDFGAIEDEMYELSRPLGLRGRVHVALAAALRAGNATLRRNAALHAFARRLRSRIRDARSR